MQVNVKPELLRWARERAGFTVDMLFKRMPRLAAWESGDVKPTLKQIERFAQIVHVPVGYMFLNEPPIESIPIQDFRTPGNKHLNQPSPDLLETIYICQQRQEWYHDYIRSNKEAACLFVGSAKLNDKIETVAAKIRQALGFEIEVRRHMRTWEEALRQFIVQTDEAGVLIMVNSIVGSNNHRKLDVSEFRGFTLSDDLAPLIFINGADTKSGQMFTLAHELAHIWLGVSGISDIEPVSSPFNAVENWCNRVAAEVLVPLEIIKSEYREEGDFNSEVARLAQYFKVSTLVILRRIFDAGYLTQNELWTEYHDALKRLMQFHRQLGGGDFYRTQTARVGKRFARALVASTFEGQTLHRDAFRMLGFSKYKTFLGFGQNLGIIRNY
jgi:Zn-dependent peptidase ImmA (M78 family)